jgi:hypothetical protein
MHRSKDDLLLYGYSITSSARRFAERDLWNVR